MVLRLANQGAPQELQWGGVSAHSLDAHRWAVGGGRDGKYNVGSLDLRSSVWFNFYQGLTMHIAGESTNQCVAGGVMEMKQVPGTREATAMDLV